MKLFKIATNIFSFFLDQRVESKEVDINPTMTVDLIPCNTFEARVFH